MSKSRLPVVPSKQFRKDYRKILERTPAVQKELEKIVDMLRNQQPLPANKRDHPLKGNLSGFRDCHIRGDLVLIYCVDQESILRLERIGSHSELGL